MEWISSGVTRWVVLIGPIAIKIPKSLRGWLGNQSEWRQRKREGVNPPILTLFHFLTLYPRAIKVGDWDPEEFPFAINVNGDEEKGESWGWFGETKKWKLIDFDVAYKEPHKGIINRLYYRNQERLGRKWAKLPVRKEGEWEEISTGPRAVP